MIDRDAVFILGAQDPEMREIERVLRRDGRAVVHAAHAARRATPRTAYAADAVLRSGQRGRPEAAVLLPNAPTVFVECSVPGWTPHGRIDHHNPGDAGFDKGPEAYLAGSSLGQTLALLDLEPDATQRLLAAADHCLTAAYQGECPGVDPRELLFLRASWQAKMSGRSLGDVIAGILAAAALIERHYDSASGEARFPDPTLSPTDLAEGAAYTGKPVRYRQLFPGGELKVMLKGATPGHITRFMDEQRALGREVYGNPWRGYAGAYC